MNCLNGVGSNSKLIGSGNSDAGLTMIDSENRMWSHMQTTIRGFA
tara:strand:- start:1512 stop:1646 length:135 start_codon:yes stop_codon:yes gene_type:complete